MKNVAIKPLATLSNPNVRIIAGQCVGQPPDHAYVIVAEQGVIRIALGASKGEMKRFLEEALRQVDIQ